jgi:hypothetical protein
VESRATSGYMIGSLVTAIVAGVSVQLITTNRYTSLRKKIHLLPEKLIL